MNQLEQNQVLAACAGERGTSRVREDAAGGDAAGARREGGSKELLEATSYDL